MQGGLDPFDDVIAGALTSITVETVVAGLIIFVTIVAGIIWAWRTTMDGLAGSFQHSQLPEKPQPVTNKSTNPLNLSPDQISKKLIEEFAGKVSASDIQDIIKDNPGLSEDQYRLLIEYFRRNGKIPHAVLGIVGVGVNKKGQINKIYYLTAGDLDHIRKEHREFDQLSNEELTNLIKQLLQQEPDEVDKNTKSVTYWYGDVKIDGKYSNIAIAVSTDPKNPGRIVTTYKEYDE